MSESNKSVLYKLAGLFFSIRGYNLIIIILAQYLAAIFILSPDELTLSDVLLDVNLFILVLCNALVIASGYLINSFYDSEKDLINKPYKTFLDNAVSQQTKLSLYFIINFVSVVLASYISFRAVLFFSGFIFGIWLYSHKLKRITFLGNVIAALLAITPFFAVFIYYKHVENIIFFHASFLFLLILIREIIKDLESLKGDFAQDYKTIPVIYGEQQTKIILSSLIGVAVIINGLFLYFFNLGYMVYYFYLSFLAYIALGILVWISSKKVHFRILHNLLKLLIVLGVFSILLIDVDLILRKVLLKL
jgi:4-hydroxybenzoate polyprenyltransferase